MFRGLGTPSSSGKSLFRDLGTPSSSGKFSFRGRRTRLWSAWATWRGSLRALLPSRQTTRGTTRPRPASLLPVHDGLCRSREAKRSRNTASARRRNANEASLALYLESRDAARPRLGGSTMGLLDGQARLPGVRTWAFLQAWARRYRSASCRIATPPDWCCLPAAGDAGRACCSGGERHRVPGSKRPGPAPL